MSHPTMFPTSHLMMKRTSNQTKFRYIIVLYGHVLVPSRVTLRLCSLLIYRIFCFLLIQESISACFFYSSASSCAFLIRLSSLEAYSCAFLIWSSSLQDYYWRCRYYPFYWFLLIASLWRNTSSNPSLSSFIMQKSAEACGCLFLSRWDQISSLR